MLVSAIFGSVATLAAAAAFQYFDRPWVVLGVVMAGVLWGWARYPILLQRFPVDEAQTRALMLAALPVVVSGVMYAVLRCLVRWKETHPS